MFPGLDAYYANPAKPLRTPGEELDDVSVDRSVRPRCEWLGGEVGHVLAGLDGYLLIG